MGSSFLNVCNVETCYFARIVGGLKQTEWRLRRKLDARLEAVEAGEPLLIRECGSDRCQRAVVVHKLRFAYANGNFVYAVRFRLEGLTFSDNTQKLQGWNRRLRD